jgi:hypothetical protein
MTTTYVCSVKDIECGSKPENWCSKCPLKLRTNGTKEVAMNESQKAFEAAYPHYDQRLGADGKHHSRVSQDAYIYFSKWLAYGRKQALEDAVQICKSVPYQNDSYVAGVTLCKSAIEKLIK